MTQLTFDFYDPEYNDLDFLHLADFGAIVRYENELRHAGLENYQIAQLEDTSARVWLQ